MVVAYLCNLLFVINHQQGYRQKDDSEALNGVLKSSGCGQLVALLQAGDEIRETQAHSRQPLLCPTVLRRKSKIKESFSILWNQLETKKRNRYTNKKIHPPNRQLYLPVPLWVPTQAGQGRQPQVRCASSGQSLHEKRLIGAKVHNSNLVVEQLW